MISTFGSHSTPAAHHKLKQDRLGALVVSLWDLNETRSGFGAGELGGLLDKVPLPSASSASAWPGGRGVPPPGDDDVSHGGDIIMGLAVEGMCGKPLWMVNELLNERRREDASARSVLKDDEEEFLEKMEMDLYKAGNKGKQVCVVWFDTRGILSPQMLGTHARDHLRGVVEAHLS